MTVPTGSNPPPAPDTTGKRGAMKLASAALAAAVAAAIAIGVLHNPPTPSAPPSAGAATTLALDSTHSITVSPDDSGNVRLALFANGGLVQTATSSKAAALTWTKGLDSLLSDTVPNVFGEVALHGVSFYLPSTEPDQSFSVQYDPMFPADTVGGGYVLTATRASPDGPIMQVPMSRASVVSIVQAVRTPAK